ncbi:uncharacterized protein BJX67DRAFT_348510 [Aspergillus lucknowensis]|uniref:Secreted protein n=1 Tax=Aspergillus lucknowensis TaxID=176173 RepID=A0ABR4LWV3_9EURO
MRVLSVRQKDHGCLSMMFLVVLGVMQRIFTANWLDGASMKLRGHIYPAILLVLLSFDRPCQASSRRSKYSILDLSLPLNYYP